MTSMFLKKAPTAALMRAAQYLQAEMRLVSELLDIQNISKPTSLQETRTRIEQNAARFSRHYIAVFVTMVPWALCTNPKLAFDAVFIFSAVVFVNSLGGKSIHIGEHQLSSSHLYTFVFLAGLLALARSSFLITLLSVTGTSSLVVLSHACFTDSKRSGH